ncbi:MAG: GNAT family N-acetyltransferase [Candidatus Hodarchaeota archaeon]
MEDVLRDFSRPAIINAIEQNLVEHTRTYGNSSLAEMREEKGLISFITEFPIATLNIIIGTRIEKQDINNVIKKTLSPYIARKTPVVWWVGPKLQAQDLGQYLENHGFKKYLDMPGMALDINKLEDKKIKPINFQVKFVSDEAYLKTWAETQDRGFGGTGETIQYYFDFEKTIGTSPNSPWQRYIGFLDDEPICVAALFLASGVAAIVNVATVSKYRERGFATLITTHLLRKAQNRGYQIGVLKATPMGQRIYRKMGFKEYCSIGMYIWQPETQ